MGGHVFMCDICFCCFEEHVFSQRNRPRLTPTSFFLTTSPPNKDPGWFQRAFLFTFLSGLKTGNSHFHRKWHVNRWNTSSVNAKDAGWLQLHFFAWELGPRVGFSKTWQAPRRVALGVFSFVSALHFFDSAYGWFKGAGACLNPICNSLLLDNILGDLWWIYGTYILNFQLLFRFWFWICICVSGCSSTMINRMQIGHAKHESVSSNMCLLALGYEISVLHTHAFVLQEL